jgi:hypothetical protein
MSLINKHKEYNTIMRFIFLLILFFHFASFFSQVVINEVHVRPTGGDTDQAFQSMYNSTPNFGSEFIEIYNTSSCDPVDISCWSIGGMDGGTNGGAFSFPSGTVIPPLGFITIGGPNTPGITFNLNVAANSARLWRSNAARWHLPNGDGWVALYDASGTAVDAVYWTFSSNDPTKLNTDATFTTGALQRIAVCGGGGLATASTIPGIEYISPLMPLLQPGLYKESQFVEAEVWQLRQPFQELNIFPRLLSQDNRMNGQLMEEIHGH